MITSKTSFSERQKIELAMQRINENYNLKTKLCNYLIENNKVKENVQKLNGELEKLDLSNTSDSSKVEQLKLQGIKLDNEIEEKIIDEVKE